MQIGKQLRTIFVEPLELPVSDPRFDTTSQPAAPKPGPAPESEEVPAAR
jgi:hypothetical protein